MPSQCLSTRACQSKLKPDVEATDNCKHVYAGALHSFLHPMTDNTSGGLRYVSSHKRIKGSSLGSCMHKGAIKHVPREPLQDATLCERPGRVMKQVTGSYM